jgi:D-amino peptidase
VNGVELGEAGLYGALAREYGAHVALATGDDVFVDETRPLFPDARFEIVKTASGASSGDTLTPAASCARIAAAARDAVERALSAGRRAGDHRPAPAACTLRVQTAALADLFCMLPTLERVDAVTLRFDARSVEHVVRTLNSLSAMSFMLR